MCSPRKQAVAEYATASANRRLTPPTDLRQRCRSPFQRGVDRWTWSSRTSCATSSTRCARSSKSGFPPIIRTKVERFLNARQGRLPPLAGHTGRKGLARLFVAGGARRDGLVAGAGQYIFEEEMGRAQGAADHPLRAEDGGPGDLHLRQRGAEGEVPAAHRPRTETWWCQGYSEPDAGSDLASLRTRAVRDGDHYVVNGTKTWTTAAHWADMMFCLVRTDTEVKPQEGISFLLLDMRDPGVEVTAHRHHGRRPGDQHRLPHGRERCRSRTASVRRTRVGPTRSSCWDTSASASRASSESKARLAYLKRDRAQSPRRRHAARGRRRTSCARWPRPRSS